MAAAKNEFTSDYEINCVINNQDYQRQLQECSKANDEDAIAWLRAHKSVYLNHFKETSQCLK